MNTTRARLQRSTGIAATLALTLGLAACGGGDGDDTPGSADGVTVADIDAVLESDEEVTIEYWTWVPDIQDTVDLFEETYPHITVNVTNAGQSADQYTKLQNAVKAGSGAPDVAQIEYFALPQFALSEAVVPLSEVGLGDLEGEYAASAWDQVSVSGAQYGFPQDTGPMVMFYREDILADLGVEVPETWDDFVEVARAIKADNPDNYITSIDPGDAGGVDSLIWQAGGRPFSVDGTTVGVDFTDEGTQQWTELYDTLVQEELVDVTAGWNDAFWRSFADGKYAMWLTGAWAPGSIRNNIPTSEGLWRAAPMPTYEAGTPMNAENGGSAITVMQQSDKKAAALAFARWMTTSPEAVLSQSQAGLFPATTGIMEDPEFLGTEDPFFGNQKTNEVFVEASQSVSSGWQYLPFQVYANSVFGDTAGQALSNATPLADGLQTWQDEAVSYGAGQGFTMAD
ncbi:ABC transporter substrate-binding protein [Sanguibacter suaedae]|uniref:Sugar ABC transporter substrate-binding protein n=1 Tax=Sanguibacter suaedae TaxID=2795737 RepID=A0A934M8S2_9MICO|nr:sugar ABC transporter substrate-binding protein [Sanguibacter suaedae]MBI9113860.1 sugar ABC transporter substrate-binding protein [Sanguibacter suaedae]